jgi:hypothetical protein
MHTHAEAAEQRAQAGEERLLEFVDAQLLPPDQPDDPARCIITRGEGHRLLFLNKLKWETGKGKDKVRFMVLLSNGA